MNSFQEKELKTLVLVLGNFFERRKRFSANIYRIGKEIVVTILKDGILYRRFHESNYQNLEYHLKGYLKIS